MTTTDGIDPNLVPDRELVSGAPMPAIGLGTFGSDHVAHDVVASAVREGLRVGYRHIDCAAVYGNERHIGAVLADIVNIAIPRDQLWISSKLWNDSHRDVATACEATLADLQLDELDMYLVHWPFPNFHPPHCDVDERNPDAVAYSHEAFLDTWRQMEQLVERGLVRHIGTSNMSIAKLDLLLAEATIPPGVNQMELHPHFQQPELWSYLRQRNIEPIGFCPIGSPDRPERDRTTSDTAPTEDPVIKTIATRHGLHPATVCVKWAVQRGHTAIPFSTSPHNLRANLVATTTERFDDEEMAAIASLDLHTRLIKGQVFLWRDDQPWQDLWDEDGSIAT